MKKRLSRSIIALLLVANVVGSMQAFAAAPITNLPCECVQSAGISSRAEECTYYYRTHNGVKQYRIWSNTECEWKIPWTNCQ